MSKITPLRAAPAPPLLDEGDLALVTFEKAAEILGGDRRVSVRYVERLASERKLRRVGHGKARRIVLASIYAFIAEEAGRAA